VSVEGPASGRPATPAAENMRLYDLLGNSKSEARRVSLLHCSNERIFVGKITRHLPSGPVAKSGYETPHMLRLRRSLLLAYQLLLGEQGVLIPVDCALGQQLGLSGCQFHALGF
jgi:hypothetical protein